jgi:hypothetical protein
MVLTSQANIEEYSGFSYSDFKIAGVKMTAPQWASFISDLIPRVEQWMYRTCRVLTFDPTSALNPIIEIQSGSGQTNYDDATPDYNPQDIVYYLRNLYLNDASLVVQEDVNDKSLPPAWVTRFARPAPATAEIDTLTIQSSPTASGNVTITLNGSYQYNIAVTAGQSTAQVATAIIAAGPQTDLGGIVWTPTAGTYNYQVVFTAGTTGVINQLVYFNPNSTMIQSYITRTQAGNIVNGGDYEVQIVNGLPRVIYYNNIPLRGVNNVKFTYNTGYAATSQEYAELVMISTRACTNFLNYKKMEQASQAIQTSGVEDIVKLWKGLNDKTLGSNGVMEDLLQYQRFPVEGPMFHDLIYATSPFGGGI